MPRPDLHAASGAVGGTQGIAAPAGTDRPSGAGTASAPAGSSTITDSYRPATVNPFSARASTYTPASGVYGGGHTGTMGFQNLRMPAPGGSGTESFGFVT